MRFLADMGVSLRVVEWLRTRGEDVVHLRDQGLQRMANGDIFTKATAEGRVVLTFDLGFGEIVALSRVLGESSEALARGAIVIAEDSRHRVRQLPIGGE